MKCQSHARGCSKQELALFTAFLNTSARLTPEQQDALKDVVIGVEVLPFAVRAHLVVEEGKRHDDRGIMSRNLSEFSSITGAMNDLASGVMQRLLSRK